MNDQFLIDLYLDLESLRNNAEKARAALKAAKGSARRAYLHARLSSLVSDIEGMQDTIQGYAEEGLTRPDFNVDYFSIQAA